MSMKKKAAGFTLIEIVIAIALTSMVLVMIFQALDRVRRNEAKFDSQRASEKEVYLLYLRLAELFKNTSSFKVFNNREETIYFRGTDKEVVFLSRTPLLSPTRSLHFIGLRFEKGRLLYREKPYQTPEEGNFVTFEELKGEPDYTLLENAEKARFQFFLYDEGVADFVWKSEVDSFEKDPLPIKFSLEMLLEGKEYNLFFQGVIKDENEKLPEYLLK